MANKFDFIIVGGGTSGSLLANRLSHAPKRPSVLLIEAGGEGLPTEHRQPYQRFANAFTLPDLDYGYSTVPQPHLGGRELSYQRGKGLGGSTMLNFMVWTRGPSTDWDRWAELVGDEEWNWKNAKERFRQIETFHDKVETSFRDYVKPSPEDHGYEGDLHISLPEKAVEQEIKITFDAGAELGFPKNLDVNSGKIIGVSVVPISAGNGTRSTSEDAFLKSRPENLTIWTKSQVARIIFEGKKAIGVETITGEKAFASKEVVLTAGSIDSAKLLLLSGIGPAHELARHNIPSVHNLPGVGKNVQDHLCVFINDLMDRSFSGKFEFALDAPAQAAALEEWTKSRSGPLAYYFSSNVAIFGKDMSTYETTAFKTLDMETQNFIQQPGVPNFEVITGGPLIPPNYPMDPDHAFTCHAVVLMNPQSTGSVILRSQDPLTAPLINPGYLSHPYDRHTIAAAVRAERALMRTTVMQKHHRGAINVPKSDSEEDIMAFIRANAGPLWHFSSTAKMGKKEDEMVVVDADLKVFGVQQLRVADISVCPFNPNAHTQAAAYLIGQTAADKIIGEYGLA